MGRQETVVVAANRAAARAHLTRALLVPRLGRTVTVSPLPRPQSRRTRTRLSVRLRHFHPHPSLEARPTPLWRHRAPVLELVPPVAPQPAPPVKERCLSTPSHSPRARILPSGFALAYRPSQIENSRAPPSGCNIGHPRHPGHSPTCCGLKPDAFRPANGRS